MSESTCGAGSRGQRPACACETPSAGRAAALAGRPCVLGLATGSTPMHVYRELVRMHRWVGVRGRRAVHAGGASGACLGTVLPGMGRTDGSSIHLRHTACREEGLSFAGVTTFNLDEYWPMDPGALQVRGAAVQAPSPDL